jgi:catechol 2,3-dioxygenase-like lactoylglutathione lyase family enzyme
MKSYGLSHVGVATHQMESTISFYENVLGFPRVVEDVTRVQSGGAVRLVYFDAGDDQFIVFMESKGVLGISDDFDTSINAALGTPRGMYHYSFKVLSLEELELRRRDLEEKGIEVTQIIDLRYAKAIFFFDPNGIQLEFCCQLRPFGKADLHQSSAVSVATTE